MPGFYQRIPYRYCILFRRNRRHNGCVHRTAPSCRRRICRSLFIQIRRSWFSTFLRSGTQHILDENNRPAYTQAMLVCYFEEWIAVFVRKTKALIKWSKIFELDGADDHTLAQYSTATGSAFLAPAPAWARYTNIHFHVKYMYVILNGSKQ